MPRKISHSGPRAWLEIFWILLLAVGCGSFLFLLLAVILQLAFGVANSEPSYFWQVAP